MFHFCCSLLDLMITCRGVAISSAQETILLQYFKKSKMSKQTFMCNSENNAGELWNYLCSCTVCKPVTTVLLWQHTLASFLPSMIQHAWRQLDSQSYLVFFKTVRISTFGGSISDLWPLTTSPVVENTGKTKQKRRGKLWRGESRVLFLIC